MNLFSSLVLSSSLSSSLLSLSLSSFSVFSLSLSPCGVVVVLLSCGVVCVRVHGACVYAVWCVVPCVRSKHLHVYVQNVPLSTEPRAHIFQHVRVVPVHMVTFRPNTRGAGWKGHSPDRTSHCSSVKPVIFSFVEHLNRMLRSSHQKNINPARVKNCNRSTALKNSTGARNCNCIR